MDLVSFSIGRSAILAYSGYTYIHMYWRSYGVGQFVFLVRLSSDDISRYGLSRFTNPFRHKLPVESNT